MKASEARIISDQVNKKPRCNDSSKLETIFKQIGIKCQKGHSEYNYHAYMSIGMAKELLNLGYKLKYTIWGRNGQDDEIKQETSTTAEVLKNVGKKVYLTKISW